MQNEVFIGEMKKIFERCFHIVRFKSLDYSKESNSLSNFELVETLTNGNISREQGIYVRLCDKVSRIGNLLDKKEASVKSEQIQDALDDLINYAAIMQICLDDKTKTVQE